MPIDDAAVHAVQHVVEAETPAPRSKTSTIPPSIETDVRLIRNAVDQQGQLLAVLHTMMVEGQQNVAAALQQFREELDAQTAKIDNITETLSAITKHLGISTTS